MITEGIKLFLNNSSDIADRLYLSSGLQHMQDTSTDGYAYYKYAVTPKSPWSLVTGSTKKHLVTHQKPPIEEFSKNIIILTLPDELIDFVQKAGISDFKNKEEVLAFNQTPTFIEASEKLKAFACQYLFSPSRFSCYHFFVEKPDLSVVTIGERKERMGMHIDNRGGVNIKDAELAPNIFLMNLGREDRYFIYINQPLETVKKMIETKNGAALDEFSNESLQYKFYQAFPDYPVVKIKIKPFECYIAPAENIIHDGSTEGNTNPSVKFLLEGYFWS
jgi:hypothetical protein